MTIVVVASAVALAVMLAVALYNLATAPRLERFTGTAATPRVSVLVPARNEADILPSALKALLASDWPDLEILVLDDNSSDATFRIAEAHAAEHPRLLRVLHGRAAPPGWLGKNWACQQLADHASGEILLFCDADVIVSPLAVRRTVAAMAAERADVLTGLPRQVLRGVFARAAVPIVMHVAVAAALPLARVARSVSPAMAIGNGQWLACTRGAYQRVGCHRAVAADVAEDLAIARRAKRVGLRLLPVVATRDLAVEMYRSAGEAWAGFRKNLYAIAGNAPPAFALVFAIFVLTMLVPFTLPVLLLFMPAFPLALAMIPLALLLGVRAVVARLFGHGAYAAVLHPVGALSVTGMALASALGSWRGTLLWNGRVLDTRRVGEVKQ